MSDLISSITLSSKRILSHLSRGDPINLILDPINYFIKVTRKQQTLLSKTAKLCNTIFKIWKVWIIFYKASFNILHQILDRVMQAFHCRKCWCSLNLCIAIQWSDKLLLFHLLIFCLNSSCQCYHQFPLKCLWFYIRWMKMILKMMVSFQQSFLCTVLSHFIQPLCKNKNVGCI